ncbi:MAG: hypothetical protein M3O34_06510 [Chloroflexota bacterium]|nr:hypothetical protein [Chloroflexota bacterium]
MQPQPLARLLIPERRQVGRPDRVIRDQVLPKWILYGLNVSTRPGPKGGRIASGATSAARWISASFVRGMTR